MEKAVVVTLFLLVGCQGLLLTKDGNVKTESGLQLGPSPSSLCTAENAGLLRFENDLLQICQKGWWSRVHITPCACGFAFPTPCGELFYDECNELRCVGNGTNPAEADDPSKILCNEPNVDTCGNIVSLGTKYDATKVDQSAFVCGQPTTDACGNTSPDLLGTALDVTECAALDPFAVPCNAPVVDSCGNDCGVVGLQWCKSCGELQTFSGDSLSNGVYWMRPTTINRQLYCDFASGGWTRVVNIKGDTNGLHAGTSSAVNADQIGLNDESVVGGKLSDAEINAISTVGFWLYRCGTTSFANAYVRNARNTWTSAYSNGEDWSLDINRVGSWVCANRPGFVFSDYCYRASPHSNFAANGDNGCYYAGGGWGRSGSLWAK